MRIAIATQNFFQPNNGQAVFAAHLAEGLAGGGHEVLVLAPSPRGRAFEESRQGVQVAAIKSIALKPFYSDVFVTPRPLGAVTARLAAFQPDIVHIQDHFPLCRGVVTAAVEAGLPLVGTNHFLPENIIPFVPVFSQFARSRAWMERYLWRMVLRVFTHVRAATSPTETAAALLRRQGLPIPVQAISCGVDLGRFTPESAVDRGTLRLRYGLDKTGTVFLFVGRVDREKRLDVLLHALHLLQRQDIQLAIVGSGRDLGGLQALARQLQLRDRVVFTGYVPFEDLPPLINSIDIFAMPSEAELQSIATLEAMATGRPVLAADARALPELVESGVNGYLFRAGDPEDAARRMAQLVTERDRWGEMGHAGLRKAQQHALPRTIERYADLYAQVLASTLPADSPPSGTANPISGAAHPSSAR